MAKTAKIIEKRTRMQETRRDKEEARTSHSVLAYLIHEN